MTDHYYSDGPFGESEVVAELSEANEALQDENEDLSEQNSRLLDRISDLNEDLRAAEDVVRHLMERPVFAAAEQVRGFLMGIIGRVSEALDPSNQADLKAALIATREDARNADVILGRALDGEKASSDDRDAA